MTATWEARSSVAGQETCAGASRHIRRGRAARLRPEPRAAVATETTSAGLASRDDANGVDASRPRPAAGERDARGREPLLCRAAGDARRYAVGAADVERDGAVRRRVDHEPQPRAVGGGLG